MKKTTLALIAVTLGAGVAANGVLYVTTQTHLYAFKEGAKPAQ
jgi:hypothetical protein